MRQLTLRGGEKILPKALYTEAEAAYEPSITDSACYPQPEGTSSLLIFEQQTQDTWKLLLAKFQGCPLCQDSFLCAHYPPPGRPSPLVSLSLRFLGECMYGQGEQDRCSGPSVSYFLCKSNHYYTISLSYWNRLVRTPLVKEGQRLNHC